MAVTDYLKCLNKSEIYDLGLVLGLDYHRVVDFEEKYSSNRRFLDSVVVSWLQKKDNVKDVSWKALVEALRHPRLGHNGIATSIATDHGMDLPLHHKHLIFGNYCTSNSIHWNMDYFCGLISGAARVPLFLWWGRSPSTFCNIYVYGAGPLSCAIGDFLLVSDQADVYVLLRMHIVKQLTSLLSPL